MSILDQIIDGSLLSTERLMQAREHYAPSRQEPSAAAAFARWTERVSVQPSLGVARELAGLSGEELAALEAEFVRCPMRPKSAWVRLAVVVGALLTVLAALGFAAEALAAPGHVATRALHLACIVCLVTGLVALGCALIAAFGTMHAALAHGTTGLYVGTLDDQHPWLYNAMSLTHHRVAEEYRQRTVASRGPLRGADFVLMRSLVEAQEALERVRPARAVADELQAVPVAPGPTPQEPRLVQVLSGRESRAAARAAS